MLLISDFFQSEQRTKWMSYFPKAAVFFFVWGTYCDYCDNYPSDCSCFSFGQQFYKDLWQINYTSIIIDQSKSPTY